MTLHSYQIIQKHVDSAVMTSSFFENPSNIANNVKPTQTLCEIGKLNQLSKITTGQVK